MVGGQSMSMHESWQAEPRLPDRVVSRIFAAMRETYGAEFDRQWAPPARSGPEDRGPELFLEALLDRWARALAGYAGRLEVIAWALDNLPRRPPNLVEFRDICNRAPTPGQQALPAPKPDPQRVAQILARLREAPRNAYPGRLGWAHRLRDQEEAGERLSRAARRMWREALGVPADAPAGRGEVA